MAVNVVCKGAEWLFTICFLVFGDNKSGVCVYHHLEPVFLTPVGFWPFT